MRLHSRRSVAMGSGHRVLRGRDGRRHFMVPVAPQGRLAARTEAEGWLHAIREGQRMTPNLSGHRDGNTYEAEFDYTRLNRQMLAVYKAMADGKWHTLGWIAK